MRPESGFAVVVLSFLASLPCASSERIEATYDFIWNGFHVAAADTVTEFTPKTYFLGIEIRTHGLLKLATRASGDIKVSGQILPDGRVQAREFSAAGTWKGDPFLQKLAFSEDGQLASAEAQRSDDWLEKNKREPVPEALKKGPDPTSLFVSLMKQPMDYAALSAPINLRTYDGETVVDWQLGCAPTPVELTQSKHSPLYGQAYECNVASTLIAGARLEEQKKTKMKRGPRGRRRPVEVSPEDEQTKVWLMAMNDADYLLPVRAEVPSAQGTVNMYLSNYAIAGRR